MAFINTLALVAILTLPLVPAHAETHSSAAFVTPVKAQQVPVKENTWSNFWRKILGQEPLRAPDLTVKVKDQSGRPLAGVSILVGQKKGEPFANNLLSSDSNGQALFNDSVFSRNPGITITAFKEGYATFSLVNNTRNLVEIELQKNPGDYDFSFFRGKVTGFPPGYGSGVLELGLFAPAFRPETLMNFDPQELITSYKVKINLYGDRDVPGNLVLPTQRKRMGFIPINVSKPTYIMPIAKGLNAHMAALVGAINISDAKDAIEKKDFLATLNMAKFTHTNWTTSRIDVNGDEQIDLHANQAIVNKALTSQMKGIPAKLDAIGVSLVDPGRDQANFVALDVKAVKSEQVKNGEAVLNLGILQQRRTDDKFYVFTGIFDRNQFTNKNATSRWIVGTLSPVDNTKLVAQTEKFLLPIQSQGVSAENREYSFSSAANPQQGLVPSFVVVNLISEKKNTLVQGHTRTLLWSAVLPGKADRLSLPNLERPVLPTPDAAKQERFLWEVTAVHTENTTLDLDVLSDLKNLKHVSSLSQKF